MHYYAQVSAAGRLAWRERQAAVTPSPAERAARAQALEPQVRAILAALDDAGRWTLGTTRKIIATDSYIVNTSVLCDSLRVSAP